MKLKGTSPKEVHDYFNYVNSKLSKVNVSNLKIKHTRSHNKSSKKTKKYSPKKSSKKKLTRAIKKLFKK